ncbi:NAD-dependent succinate-semialdehyde dehydrogenase [Psychrobium sp. 1_MG-2023]|uniref:NAD-dependent succinate-semialdehyde dehydrogenase n=1 Tax=Psychrobium sp. 1_MG-2023 TaxID=3062624 RepID=UPI000C31FDE5|nr:NAD-dependent succinate-semialdehyde dehydrogenase [Psychrobium sp. 1_MG-2023]MDP2560601.1 NAD-dependent succinate-semialdehyde dehydrogenase [Psychrobium sp. 1_MG-2023]PKF57587.1 succinate-semialdehyde dehydrogenase (NADP(+)) [Alteromonadales bacterium alter-6D02]
MLNLSNPALLKQSSFINGQFIQQNDRDLFDVVNPSSGLCISQVVNAGGLEAEQAVLAADGALSTWRKTTAATRCELLKRWHQLIVDNSQDLARILTVEQGKPLNEAAGEIAYGASYIDWFANEAIRQYGETIPSPTSINRGIALRQPVGVVCAITPWNFPQAMIARKAAAALAAGCTFVVKPSELTPLSALAMAYLAEQAGIPAGVFNVVVGADAPEIGKVLTQHPLVRKFSFTGSTAVGKQLNQQCAATIKRVSMELGGNAPFIVFADADLDAAVAGAMASKFRNAGQTCISANRFIIHESVKAAFIDKLQNEMATLVMGDGLEAQSAIGPLIHRQAVERVRQLVVSAIEQGARLHWQQSVNDNQQPCFYPPTLLEQVENTMTIAQTEIFGPVVTIQTFSDEAQAISLANDTDYGLAAYFYARDIGTIWRVSEALDFGMVGANEGAISNASAPFGGVKQSGFGREGSKHGLDDYSEIKYVCLGGLGT